MQLIDKAPGVSRIATTNIMMTNRGPMFFSDTAINVNPSATELAKIALMTAGIVKMFGMDPVIAMVSYSNFGSSTNNESADKVREAVAYLLKELNQVDSIGPIILGLDKPVHIFQLGASVEEMVNMAAVAVVDAQEKEKRNKMIKVSF
jgi:malate dehydrogenase (oxaloacetate-decarboxylating)(NADP+)